MAHWQQGNQDEARQWYQRAVEWMELKKLNDEELLRFRAEAEQLMGISEADQPEQEKKATDKEKIDKVEADDQGPANAAGPTSQSVIPDVN